MSDQELLLKFTTSQEKYKCSETEYNVPARATNKELNTLVKEILQNEKKLEKNSSVDFDFLIEKQFLLSNDSTVLEHVLENQLSQEKILNVEFFVKQSAPEKKNSFEINDWISSLKLSNEGLLLIGSYDSSVAIWSSKKEDFIYKQTTFHEEAVKAVEWISTKGDKLHFASASMDQHIILYEADTNGDKIKPVICCKGHAESVECLNFNPRNNLMASGSWDTTVKIWSGAVQVSDNDKNRIDPELQSRKKRQKSDLKGFPRPALITLGGHKENVTGVQWIDNGSIVTSSMDHTVKLWDIEEETIKTDMRASLAVMCLDHSHMNNLIATGCADRHIRLWDSRVTVGKVVKSTLTSHHNWVTSVKWSPTNEHQLVSGSFDKYVKTWDIRSAKTALYEMIAHKDNVLSVDWNNDQIVSGGQDKKVFIYAASSREGNSQKEKQVI